MPLVSSNLLSTNPLQAALSSKLNTSPLAKFSNNMFASPSTIFSGNTSSTTPVKTATPAAAPVATPHPQALPGNVLSGMSIPDYQALVARNRAKQAAVMATQTPAPAQPRLTVASQTPTPLSFSNPNQPAAEKVAPGQVVTAQNSQPSAPTPTFPGLISGIATAGQGNIPIGQNAAAIALDYGKRIADVGEKGINAQAGYRTTGTTPVAEGNAAVIAQTTAAQQSSLAKAEEAALQGTGQQLTAQGQEASALSAAGGLAKPEVGSYGQTFYNPLTGTSLGNGEFDSALEQYAQLAAKGQLNAIPAAVMGNPVLNARVLQRAQQINPQFNYNTAVGTGSAQESLAQTGGTAEQQANIGIYQKALDGVATLTNQLNNVDGLGSLLVQTATTGGLNPSNVRYANQSIAQIRTQLSSAEQAQFDSTLATLQSKIANLLQVGGADIPSDVTAKANRVLDGSLALSALPSVLSQISTEGNIILKNQSDIATKAYTNIQGSGGTQTSSGTGSVSAGGYNFKLVNGQWVPA